MLTPNPNRFRNPRNSSQSWNARLQLGLKRINNKTVLCHRNHYGPLVVQKPFYPESVSVCHLYIIHPPGGVVGGDSLELEIELSKNAHSLITTPSAGKFYRSDGRLASQSQSIILKENAVLEWFPIENIYFNHAIVSQKTVVILQNSSKFIGWDFICLGRRAAKEKFTDGHLNQSFEVYCQGLPILVERNRLSGGEEALSAAWGYQGKVVSGVFIVFPANKQMLEDVRQIVTDESKSVEYLLSVTLKGSMLVCRYLGNEAEPGREIFCQLWKTVRRTLLGLEICAPRIWQS